MDPNKTLSLPFVEPNLRVDERRDIVTSRGQPEGRRPQSRAGTRGNPGPLGGAGRAGPEGSDE